MYTPTAADFADTGQWRLILNIRREGLDAWLQNTLHPEYPPQKLCESSWHDSKLSLLKNLEEAVYQSPRLLDDFATRIVLFDSHTLFVPVEYAEETAESETELYNAIYKAESNDIMTETRQGITAIWTMAPGVREFLLRTFPGARLTCNLMEKVSETMADKTGTALKAEIRDKEADVVLIDEEGLLAASTIEWEKRSEIDKYIEDVLKAYGHDGADTDIKIEDRR